MKPEQWAEIWNLKAKADRWACGEGDVSEAGRAVQECLLVIHRLTLEIQEQHRSLTERAIDWITRRERDE